MADDQQLTSDLASLRINRGGEVESYGQRRRWWLPVLLIALVAGGGALWQRAKGPGTLAAADVQLGQVSLISPSQADVRLVATGYVVAKRKATVAARTPGRLLHLYVDENDRVKKDQLVAEIDRADVDAQIATAKADVAFARAKVEEAHAQLADAEIKAKRERELMGRGAGTSANVDDANARVAIAKAQHLSAEANVEAIQQHIRSAEVALDYTKIRAPFDGVVLRKLAEVGEMMNPTGAQAGGGVFTIAGFDDLQVEADVSETQLAKVLLPTTPSLKNTTPLAQHDAGAPAEIVLDAFPDRRFRGQVIDVRPTVDRAKATVTVKVKFTDPTDGVLPDMSAKVSFLSKPIDEKAVEQAPKRVLPSDAVAERDGRRVVFTVEKDRVKMVQVLVKGPFAGAGTTALVEIAEGPAPGTQLVRSPAAELSDGARIKLPE